MHPPIAAQHTIPDTQQHTHAWLTRIGHAHIMTLHYTRCALNWLHSMLMEKTQHDKSMWNMETRVMLHDTPLTATLTSITLSGVLHPTDLTSSGIAQCRSLHTLRVCGAEPHMPAETRPQPTLRLGTALSELAHALGAAGIALQHLELTDLSSRSLAYLTPWLANQHRSLVTLIYTCASVSPPDTNTSTASHG